RGRRTRSGSRPTRCGTRPGGPRSCCSASASSGLGSALGGRGVRAAGFRRLLPATTAVAAVVTVEDLLGVARLAVGEGDGAVEGVLGVLFGADRVVHVEP